MAKALYQLLGVPEDAHDDTIRSAYRTLAKKYHPDRNPGDRAAEEKFKQVSAAFDILGDREKRLRYDRGQIDGTGRERHAHDASAAGFGGARARSRAYATGDAYDIGSVFSDLFGNGGAGGRPPVRGDDARYRLEIDLLEAVRGVKKRVMMPDGRHLDVAIPPGVRDGQSLRLKGRGGTGSFGGSPGDIYVDIEIRAHPFFSVEGRNILLQLPISLKEALLGAQISIPSLEGSIVLKVPPRTDSGVRLRIKGRGLKDPKTGKTGDQIVTTRLLLPKDRSEDLDMLIDALEDTRAVEERRHFDRQE